MGKEEEEEGVAGGALLYFHFHFGLTSVPLAAPAVLLLLLLLFLFYCLKLGEGLFCHMSVFKPHVPLVTDRMGPPDADLLFNFQSQVDSRWPPGPTDPQKHTQKMTAAVKFTDVDSIWNSEQVVQSFGL